MRVIDHIDYDFERSFERLQEILDSTETFDEVDGVPHRDKLTYNNGFYINCYSIFVDTRHSSKLPEKYKKSTLAKIYRAYISEVVALLQSMLKCKEINIVGDSVWGVFEFEKASDVIQVLHAGYAAMSIIKTLNYKLCQKSIDPIIIGVGIDKGQALMIQAGFKGSSINDVIYMGGVVNSASKLCSKAGKNSYSEIAISEAVYSDLKGHDNGQGKFYQDMFLKNLDNNFYLAALVRIDMENWLATEMAKKPCLR